MRGKEEGKKGLAGSLSLEASFALPLFFFLMLTLCSAFAMLEQQNRILAALYETAVPMGEHAYYASWAGEAAGTGDGKENPLLAAVGSVALSETYVRSAVGRYLEETDGVLPVMKGGPGGISYLRSRIPADSGEIELVADYRVFPYLGLFLPEGLRMEARVTGRAWVGYGRPDEESGEGENGPVVFVTETGRVYHLTRECTYLRLSTRRVSALQTGSLRNRSGARYYACEICRPRGERTVYITEDGNRYHREGCSALKRTVREIPLEEARKTCAPCSRCGGTGQR